MQNQDSHSNSNNKLLVLFYFILFRNCTKLAGKKKRKKDMT